ncbi:WD40/YVTN/BNR-like repeat-containing protein [Maribacter antarcticus]|uniref:WD40/YVTN/BNR-like repeat-containing protein n=1 Tax=Maribacter antarcticus TaxID=505250 RepID=UPI00047B8BAD|nr:oxidoreductase [Maribacter antarcticus]
MRHFSFLIVFILLVSCSQKEKQILFTSVGVQNLYTDSLSIRAIEIMENSLAFAANKGTFGSIDLTTGKVRSNIQKYHTSIPEFRAVAHTSTDFFMLSVANPALLYKTGDQGNMELVYKEEDDAVFYDAMTFWNDSEGIAIGDTMDGCISIIITRDGGNTWVKLPCSNVPEGIEGEGAFAASNTNIAVVGDNTWIATTKRVLFSPDKGSTWEVQATPIRTLEPTEGIYAIDFYDENLGVAIGGDYSSPEGNNANKAITLDGGKTWELMAESSLPNYKSCIQFVPGTKGQGIVALGFTGIAYSSNQGNSWKQLSDESFFTLRFQNDTIAYAAGRNRIAKLIFR